MTSPTYDAVIISLIIALVLFLKWSRLHRISRMAKQNFDWYRRTHPELVTNNGVKCHSCGGNRIHARGLMQRTFLREHFCTQCGTALYYSREVGV